MNSYNDGILEIYKSKALTTNFSAKINETKKSDFIFIMNVYFHEETKRQQDFLFANSLERTLNLKVKVPYTKKIKVNHKAIYNNYLYDIIYIDFSKDKKELYIYLEEVRKFGI